MATIQTDGITQVTDISTNNNSGVIKSGGVFGGDFNSSPLSFEDVGVFGSTIIDNNNADKALDGGIFAYNNERPISKRTTTTLATTPEDFLQSGASAPSTNKLYHYVENIRISESTKAIREGQYNFYNGSYDSGYPVVYSYSFTKPSNATVFKSGIFFLSKS